MNISILCSVYMKNILISGSSGFIGRELCLKLKSNATNVRRLVRDKSLVKEDSFFWDPITKEINLSAFDNIDCVINLSGEPIAQRWNNKSKKAISDSRIISTQFLVESMNLAKSRASLINSSGINYYGSNVGFIDYDETFQFNPDGFLSEVCHKWEAEAKAIETSQFNNRLVILRTGVVINPKGGALKRMLVPFKMGLGGAIGTGNQWISWIELGDFIKVILWAIDSDYSGYVNAVAPYPIKNKEFSKVLSQTLKRPSFFPLPTWAVDMAFGQMGRETVLADIGVLPKVLMNEGFEWSCPSIESALAKGLLNK